MSKLRDIIKKAPRRPWASNSFAKWYDDKNPTQRNYSRYVGAFDPALTDALVRLYEAERAVIDSSRNTIVYGDAAIEKMGDAVDASYDSVTAILTERGLL